MAVAVVDPAVQRLAKALGLKDCRSAVLRISVDEVVMLTTECFARGPDLERLAGEIETGEFVVIEKAIYERLKNSERGVA